MLHAISIKSFMRFENVLLSILLVILSSIVFSFEIEDNFSVNVDDPIDKELLKEITNFIPQLTSNSHKGQSGRIAVIGGSEEYSGAPYFSAISSLKVGGDLSFVFTTKKTAPIIKSYSPELIVYPYLDTDDGVEKILQLAHRMSAFVIGPGLGKNPQVLEAVEKIIYKLREMDKLMVIDADGLKIVNKNPNLIKNYTKVILTPNLAELKSLSYSTLNKEISMEKVKENQSEVVKCISIALGKVTIFGKGAADIISNGTLTLSLVGGGSNRRCGGQGDLLSGSIAVFYSWANAHAQNSKFHPPILASVAGSRFTRETARLAYEKYGRSTTTVDMISLIHQAFESIFGE